MSLYAYADPVYLGCGKLYPEHPDARQWDDPETHRFLIDSLIDQYPDGWALSASSVSLLTLAPMLPRHARLCSWTKPFASFKPNVNPGYTWEPVILVGGRRSRARTEMTVKDHIIEPGDAFCEPITLRKGLTGAKPERVCNWILDLLGFRVDDQLDDLFPGTGVMGRVVEKRQNADTFLAGTLFATAPVTEDPEPEPPASIGSLIEKSSLGTPGAKGLRALAPGTRDLAR